MTTTPNSLTPEVIDLCLAAGLNPLTHTLSFTIPIEEVAGALLRLFGEEESQRFCTNLLKSMNLAAFAESIDLLDALATYADFCCGECGTHVPDGQSLCAECEAGFKEVE